MDIISRFDPGKAHQAHGGTIQATSSKDAGTTFTVTL
jgi:signal transduction histidine kinase